MKISIIGGAGTLGATSAFVIAQQNLADEICLIDVKENIAKSHEMDMGQAAAAFSGTKITSGGFEQLADSDIVIITAGIPESQIKSRMDLLEGNLKVISQISSYLKRYASEAIMITITNPVDIINSILGRYGIFNRNRLIGFNLNDSFRFRWAISNALGVKLTSVEAMVIGEHGEAQCPLYSSIAVNGQKVELLHEQKKIVDKTIKNWFAEYQALNAGRTSGWLSAVNIARLVSAIVRETGEVLPCSVIDDQGVSIGQPVILGKNGVKSIVDIEITEEERFQWIAARERLAHIVSSLFNKEYFF